MMLYLINENIEFRAGKNRLVLRGASDVSVKLTWPAAQCLEIILEHRGSIVPHTELYRRVWEEKGMNVPPNTLYQNISIIRRALKSIVPDGDKIIRTLPKRGFCIHDDAAVETVNIRHAQPVVTEIVNTGNDVPLSTEQTPKNPKKMRASLFSRTGKLMTMLCRLFIFGSPVGFPVVDAKSGGNRILQEE